jgi:hypothetical protein
MDAKCTHGYKLRLYKLGLDSDRNTAGDILMATVPQPTVVVTYKAYVLVFSTADSESMLRHSH